MRSRVESSITNAKVPLDANDDGYRACEIYQQGRWVVSIDAHCPDHSIARTRITAHTTTTTTPLSKQKASTAASHDGPRTIADEFLNSTVKKATAEASSVVSGDGACAVWPVSFFHQLVRYGRIGSASASGAYRRGRSCGSPLTNFG